MSKNFVIEKDETNGESKGEAKSNLKRFRSSGDNDYHPTRPYENLSQSYLTSRVLESADLDEVVGCLVELIIKGDESLAPLLATTYIHATNQSLEHIKHFWCSAGVYLNYPDISKGVKLENGLIEKVNYYIETAWDDLLEGIDAKVKAGTYAELPYEHWTPVKYNTVKLPPIQDDLVKSVNESLNQEINNILDTEDE